MNEFDTGWIELKMTAEDLPPGEGSFNSKGSGLTVLSEAEFEDQLESNFGSSTLASYKNWQERYKDERDFKDDHRNSQQ